MHAHPDADAFVRAILRDPADVTTRRVFADWLEETGEVSNVAWARFIRLNIQIADSPAGVARENLITETYQHLPAIRAHLRIPASIFIKHHTALEQVLPLAHLSVTLRGFAPEPRVKALFVRQIIELYQIFPLAWLPAGDSVWIVLADMRNKEAVTDDLRNLFALREILVVRTSNADLRHAIHVCYPAQPREVPLPQLSDLPRVSLYGDLID